MIEEATSFWSCECSNPYKSGLPFYLRATHRYLVRSSKGMCWEISIRAKHYLRSKVSTATQLEEKNICICIKKTITCLIRVGWAKGKNFLCTLRWRRHRNYRSPSKQNHIRSSDAGKSIKANLIAGRNST